MIGWFALFMNAEPHNRRDQELEQDETFPALERRLGRFYARQRPGIELDHEARISGMGEFLSPRELVRGTLLDSARAQAERT